MKSKLLNFSHKAGLILLVAATMAVTGCRTSSSSMPPIPEVYDGDTVEECYYIVGTLSSDGSALSGATVSAGGAIATSDSTSGEYKLTIDKENFASNMTVSFSKSDYITVESIAIFPTSETGTIVTVNASLTKRAEAVAVNSSTETTIGVGADTSTSQATVTIPANVVTEGTTLSTTPYTPGNTEEVVSSESATTQTTINDVSAPASVLAMEFSEAISPTSTFSVDIPLNSATLTKASSSESYAFSNVKAVKYENSAWSSLTDSNTYFKDSHYEVNVCYDDLLDGKTINVSISPSFTVVASESASEALIDPSVIDNLGSTAIVSKEVGYTMKQGLVYSDCTCTNAEYCTETIKSEMASYLATMLGASFDSSSLSFTDTFTVSGDSKLTVSYSQSYRTYSITAKVSSIDANGELADDALDVIYSAKYYGAVSRSLEEETGDLTYTHND